MKRIFLHAYDGVNLGDDLFVRMLCRRYPQTQFAVWGDETRRVVFRDIPNLRILNRENWLSRLLGAIRPSFAARYRNWREDRCDGAVHIGGSVFMEYPGWEQTARRWLWEAERRKTYVLGANFGPYTEEAYRNAMAEAFAKMEDVCFRDRYSRGLFGGNVRYAPDILLGYPMPEVNIREKQLFVSVIDCARKEESGNTLEIYEAGYLAGMAKLLSGYLDRGWTLVMASFCRREGDETGIAKALDAMGISAEDPRIRALRYDGSNTEEILAALAGSGAVIASRFHAAVLALAADRPVLPVAYSRKTIRALADMGFDGAVVDLREEAPWEQSWNSPVAAEIRKAAAGHFEKLDAFLGREDGACGKDQYHHSGV